MTNREKTKKRCLTKKIVTAWFPTCLMAINPSFLLSQTVFHFISHLFFDVSRMACGIDKSNSSEESRRQHTIGSKTNTMWVFPLSCDYVTFLCQTIVPDAHVIIGAQENFWILPSERTPYMPRILVFQRALKKSNLEKERDFFVHKWYNYKKTEIRCGLKCWEKTDKRSYHYHHIKGCMT